ncbi:MAG TPA: carboxypeptidase regulatory-like domain-containing protein, partial [Gemmatimonadaceae bacterium]|nr:carboxypeptidase regulatory-like domain-containing protein [Gemmatimonadaceae bacterium]
MSITRSRLSALAAALLLAVAVRPAAAQVTTGGIAGRVVSPAGEPIESAQIQVTNTATGRTVGTLTRENGSYSIIGLEAGSAYEVTARRIGFQAVTQRGVRVALGLQTPLDFTLTPAATQLAAVTVEASTEPAIIAPDHRGTQTSISDTLIRRLPTLNRNFTDFVALTPQVGNSGPGLSGAGTNNRFNNIQIDGATEADLFGLGSTGQPGGQANGKSIGLEAVKEYQVLLAPYDVRLGNFSGALINAVTKSGRNEFFGSAYAFGRNESFVRSQDYIDEFRQIQYGFSLGGPIVRDKALFFVNAEIQDRQTPAGGPSINNGTSLTSGQIDAFKAQLAERGMNVAGTGAAVTNENPLQNIFARLDFNLPHSTTLVLRHNFGHAEDDVFSRSRSGSSPSFNLSDAGYLFKSDKNATVAQLRTNLSNGAYNEFIAGYTTIRDRRAPAVEGLPQVDMIISGVATLTAGSERSSQANELDQDIIELTDNFTIPVGESHRVTVGTQNTFYKVRNLFGQNRYGYWVFNSPEDLAAGTAREYRVGVPVTNGQIGEGDGAVRFSAFNWSLYAEDEWTISPRFNITYGLRVEAPTFSDKPPYNPDVEEIFGRRTDEVPSNNITFSPRFGFNWDPTGDATQQIRGGVGVFTGRPAYVWLSNAFQNSGGFSGYAQLTCRGDDTPAFTAAAVASPPRACSDGTTARAGSEVDLLSEDLKFPQNLRANLAYDRQIFDDYTVTFEALYTRGINNLFYQNIALAGPVGTDPDGRVLYGLQPEEPNLVDPGRDVVLDVTNQSKDYSYSLTAGIARRFTQNFGGSVYYTYSQAKDVQNLTSSTAFSQYRFGRPLVTRQEDLSLGTSIFSQPHRIVATGTYTFPTRTTVSAIYVGQSGQAFGYVSSGDLNGDGLTLNDPVYVPTGPDDPRAPVFEQQMR